MHNNKYTTLTDESLMAAFVHRHDKVAFGHLYQRHFSSLSKYLGWLTHDPEKGKDLAQAIFMKIYQNPDLFDTSKYFKVWLLVVAKNQWKNEVRNTAVRENAVENIRHLQRLQDVSHPEMETGQRHRLAQIKAAVEQLSESHREVFVLKYTNNLTLGEISQVCNCSVGTVKSRLFYALKNLKTQLKDTKIKEV